MSALAVAWLLFFLAFVAGHLRVRKQRRSAPTKEDRVLRAPASNYGLLLQGVALSLAAAFHTHPRPSWAPAVWILAYGSVAFGAWALLTLGRHWRIQAVVTADHELITAGPYALVRHPVYLALFGMLAATLLARAPWPAALVSIVIYLAGTEIRVRAEDGILARTFGQAFESYRRSTAAYLPWLR
ncbi:MAG: isoprenylcysteine carboxylmethyltransferase family protein [Bryobacteraceae bacterium]